MRQTIHETEEAELRERERVRKVEEERRMARWEIEREDEELRRKRAARKKAKQEAAEKAAKESANCGVAEAKVEDGGRVATLPACELDAVNEPSHPSPSIPLPVEGRGGSNAPGVLGAAPIVPAGPQRSDSLASRGTSGERAGERGISTNTFSADEPAAKNTDGAWQPSVVEEREYAENFMAEEAENRSTPLNANAFREFRPWTVYVQPLMAKRGMKKNVLVALRTL